MSHIFRFTTAYLTESNFQVFELWSKLLLTKLLFDLCKNRNVYMIKLIKIFFIKKDNQKKKDMWSKISENLRNLYCVDMLGNIFLFKNLFICIKIDINKCVKNLFL